MGYKKIIIFLSIAFIFNKTANAQQPVPEIGIVGGGAGYIGDLNQDNLLKLSGTSLGAYVKVSFNPFLSFGLHFTRAAVKADDATATNAYFRDRNLNFASPINELSFIIDYNFFDLYSIESKKKFSPYIFAGIGGILFEPTVTHAGTTIDKVRRLNTEAQALSYKHYTLTIPFGVGVKYKVKNNWSVFSQIGYRTANTDFLDDVSGTYPTTSVTKGSINLSNPSTVIGVGLPGTQRGDFRKRDTYMFVSIGISYTFVSQKCYNF